MPDSFTDGFIENRTFDELHIGDSASLTHRVTQRDIDLFATVTGDTTTAILTLRENRPEKGDVTLGCACTNQAGEVVISGTAQARAPREKIRRPRTALPEVRVGRHLAVRALLTRTAGFIAPDLMEKAGIVQNAIDLVHVLDIPQPRVAVLAAVEMVNAHMQATLDVAALCKMVERGQTLARWSMAPWPSTMRSAPPRRPLARLRRA